jgi:hypothetical protein
LLDVPTMRRADNALNGGTSMFPRRSDASPRTRDLCTGGPPPQGGAIARPDEFAELQVRLGRCRTDGTEAVAAVAGYILENPYDVAFGTSRSVAHRCSVSATSVMRVARTLGFSGFHDMREFHRDLLIGHVGSGKPARIRPATGPDGPAQRE